MQNQIVKNVENINKNVQIACSECGRDASSVTVLVATKTVEPQRINQLVGAGIVYAGENRVQEFCDKYDEVKGLKWHFIGSLQTNKVKYIIDKVEMIHSVDRVSLIDEIDSRSGKIGKKMEILLEINAGQEESKSGVGVQNLKALYEYAMQKQNIKVVGLMPVLPIETDENLYKQMQQIFQQYKAINSDIVHLSMGMSGDYQTAIKYGATIIRLGTIVFGERNYN